jgi:AcrR family transcriptional regulator
MAQISAKSGRRLSVEQRREHLLDVAADVLREDGTAAFSMEAVKERAGVSRGLVYVYFQNADELAFALYEREVAELDRRIGEVRGVKGFEERVRAAMKTYLDFAGERGGVLAMLQVKLSGRWAEPSVQRALGERFRFWSEEIERETGVPSHIADALARASVSAVEAFAAAWRAKRLRRREAEEMGVAFALAGVRAATEAR